MGRRYMNLESKLCRELELLEEKYRNGAEMSEGDLRKIDLLSHAMKCLATFVAMREADNANYMENYYPYDNSMSNARGRDSMGRFISRNTMSQDMMNHSMSPDMSGRYPYYQEERRW